MQEERQKKEGHSPAAIVQHSSDWLEGARAPLPTPANWAWCMVIICMATTESTSTSMRLNSSKQAHAPELDVWSWGCRWRGSRVHRRSREAYGWIINEGTQSLTQSSCQCCRGERAAEKLESYIITWCHYVVRRVRETSQWRQSWSDRHTLNL